MEINLIWNKSYSIEYTRISRSKIEYNLADIEAQKNANAVLAMR